MPMRFASMHECMHALVFAAAQTPRAQREFKRQAQTLIHAPATSSSNCTLAVLCAFSLWNVMRTVVHSCLSNAYVRGF